MEETALPSMSQDGNHIAHILGEILYHRFIKTANILTTNLALTLVTKGLAELRVLPEEELCDQVEILKQCFRNLAQ
jgi:hypothetical protein